MKLSIKDLPLPGRRVFIRVDFNVPLKDGVISDDTRIRATLPTLDYGLRNQAALVLASHLGRPKSKPTPAYSLRPVAAHLATLLGRRVEFASDCVGDPAQKAIADAGDGGVTLLENLRFHSGEEANDPEFAKALASLAELYVNDAFGAAHRAHASTEGVPRLMPMAAAGLLMLAELDYLGGALQSPKRPFVAVMGGAKVSDKLELLENLLDRVDALVIGGAMAYTFFKARGLPVGRSLVEDDQLDAAHRIARKAEALGVQLALPTDHVVADRLDAAAAHETLAVDDPAIGDRMGLDIGPDAVRRYETILRKTRTVVWNGPMGVFELEPFAAGTIAIAKAIADVQGVTIIGGGDSIAAAAKAGVINRITHVSTGGGASLEFLAGRTLPGVAALTDK